MEYLAVILAVINIAGFIMTASDKHKARKNKWRIPEKLFFLTCLAGGCPGVYAGLLTFRHKTRHWYFMIGIPIIFIFQVALIILAFRQGFFDNLH